LELLDSEKNNTAMSLFDSFSYVIAYYK